MDAPGVGSDPIYGGVEQSREQVTAAAAPSARRALAVPLVAGALGMLAGPWLLRRRKAAP
jgi:hypothetical protein